MGYVKRVPTLLRQALQTEMSRFGGAQVKINLWEEVCEIGGSSFIRWYHEANNRWDVTYEWPHRIRKLDALFEHNRQGLINRLILLEDVRLLRDLASAAVRCGQLVVVMKIIVIFEQFKLDYWRCSWATHTLEEAVDERQWEIVSYLLDKGFSVSGRYLRILSDPPGEDYMKFKELREERRFIRVHYYGKEFPEN